MRSDFILDETLESDKKIGIFSRGVVQEESSCHLQLTKILLTIEHQRLTEWNVIIR